LPHYPFTNGDEWTLVEWLGTSGLSKKKVNVYLNTPWVKNKHCPQSFRNAEEMYECIDKFLPAGPQWYCEEVTLPEAPNEPQLSFYCDPVECLQFLAANPTFDEHQTYGPVKYFTDKELKDRVYGEM
ncbi:hypothetical protein K439DRAFT_1282474, partial [Ramaria rubella]